MPIATKNGSIVFKDGNAAETCTCCAGACSQVSTVPPLSVKLKIRTTSQDQISSMRFVSTSGGQTTIAHTSFMACAAANGTHTLVRNLDYIGSFVEVYNFQNMAISAQLQFYSTPPAPYYQHWELSIGGGFLRMVQEYGASAAIRSRSVMASDEWNANTVTSSFPGSWSSSQSQSISNTGYAGYPTVTIGHICGGTDLCRFRTGRATFYNLGWRNNSQGVFFRGWCGQIIGSSDFSIHEDCGGCENTISAPVPAAFQRMDLPGFAIYSPGFTIAERNIEYPVNYYFSKFQLDWDLEEIVFVYADREVVVPI